MKGKRMIAAAAGAVVLLAAAGCGSGQQAEETAQVIEGLDKLSDIVVVAREEGSGTRSTFAELAGFSGEDPKRADLTTEDAQIGETPEEVCSLVKENASAVGYISQGSITEDDQVKIVNIDGLSPGDKAYPLSRTFYLAYSGTLSELEQDFLTYVHGAGQEIVGESYGTVAKSSSFLSNKAEGTVTIGGSTSVAPLMEELAGAYMQLNPGADITVEATDSGDGLTKAMSGEYDLGMSSRELQDYEQELLDYEAIAKDNIAVIVNCENPVESLGLEELKSIFTGEMKEWEELNK